MSNNDPTPTIQSAGAREPIVEAIVTARELLPNWIDVTARLPAMHAMIDRLTDNWALVKNSKKMAQKYGYEPEPWVGELKAKTEREWHGWKGMKADLKRYESEKQKLAEAVRSICRFAHQAGIDANPLRRLFDLQEFDNYPDALLVLGQVEDAVGAERGKTADKPSDEPAPEIDQPPVTDNDERVLQYLLEMHPRLRVLVEIAAGAKVSQETARKAVEKLRAAGCVSRPKPRKGVVLTTKGKELAERLTHNPAP